MAGFWHPAHMTPKRFRKRPGEIDAMQWDGTPESADAIMAWCPTFSGIGPGPVDWRVQHGIVLDGNGHADDVYAGDWVVCEPDGTFCGMSASAFAATYEPADGGPS